LRRDQDVGEKLLDTEAVRVGVWHFVVPEVQLVGPRAQKHLLSESRSGAVAGTRTRRGALRSEVGARRENTQRPRARAGIVIGRVQRLAATATAASARSKATQHDRHKAASQRNSHYPLHSCRIPSD